MKNIKIYTEMIKDQTDKKYVKFAKLNTYLAEHGYFNAF